MKTIKILILIGFFAGLLSCSKDDTEKISNPDVETYIELLKANQYDSFKLPEFSADDIPALLQYINDFSVVNKFPSNPISSYAEPNPDYRLSVLVLWTIESIRLAAMDNKLVLGFASQNPFVQTKSEPIEWLTDHDSEIYNTIRQAYSNWWNENKHKKFSIFYNIDPLLETEYRWH
ncbi:DUF4943 domain-containing protein [Mariniphaga sediminis]|jgi:hypothetical protein|uniref:DUF4943 domain-containing protein n=1 Tax=Mariniphaga sediminis TaxID=1628158 RepID=A0A399CXG9_9BACT|nr:DUF4943 family protein [Mariniphaga sediminis]RIH62750.1 DUF4943 domain-containing protein [Mariniphaga sediminis]